MTLKEAHEYAQKRLPVVNHGIVYPRIISIGYNYGKDGRAYPTVTLEDRGGNSITHADPAMCSLYEQEEQRDVESQSQ